MSKQPTETMTRRRHRWSSFSLRTLFVVVTFCGVVLGWLALQLGIISQRRTAIRNLPDGSYFVRYSEFGPGHAQPQLSTTAKMRRWLGDEPVEYFWIPKDEYKKVAGSLKTLFPEADIGEGAPSSPPANSHD
jgi:hypothetical protein